MLIRFNTTINDTGTKFMAGEEHDLPDDQANHYVQSGIANKTAETSGGHKPGRVTPGAIKAPDPASQAAADAYRGVTQPFGTPALSSDQPPADETTAIPGAEVNPAYVAPDALPSLAGKPAAVAKKTK